MYLNTELPRYGGSARVRTLVFHGREAVKELHMAATEGLGIFLLLCIVDL
jgi:hypothetical protein